MMRERFLQSRLRMISDITCVSVRLADGYVLMREVKVCIIYALASTSRVQRTFAMNSVRRIVSTSGPL